MLWFTSVNLWAECDAKISIDRMGNGNGRPKIPFG